MYMCNIVLSMTGNAVLPFNSNYTGVVNCMQSIISEEGVTGLYKGFGALVMQYTVQVIHSHT